LAIRIYALNAEPNPRVILFPGWTTAEESEEGWVDDEGRRELAKQADRTAEVPVEIFLQQA
jgi:hypothetical protein